MELPPTKQHRIPSNPPLMSASSRIKPTLLAELFSFLQTVVILVLLAGALNASVVQAFKIPSGSMKPTLQIGDHLLVSKLSYGIRLPLMTNTVYQYSTPKRGDIVVFTRPDDPMTPEDDSSINLIKRVIGLPGDVVELQGTTLRINNQIYPEPYARYEDGGIQGGDFGPVTIPTDHVLMLGDNRDHSKDSRFWTDPFLPIARIKGRALILYWSKAGLDRIGMVVR